MLERNGGENNPPFTVRSGRDAALADALERLAPGRRPRPADRRICTSPRWAPVARICRVPRLSPRRSTPPAGCARSARDRAALHPPGRGDHHALAGRNVVVITPTASGKTLCYNAPVLNADPRRIRRAARCICFRPRRSRRISSPSCTASASAASTRRRRAEIGVFTYDGDTPQDARRAIRDARARRAQQPRHAALGDPAAPSALGEAVREPAVTSSSTSCTPIAACSAAISATCCGGCGAICRHYGSDPVFICSSATIANPRELAERLTERPFELVDESGAPRGEKFFLFVNPPVVNQQLGIRRSYLARGAARRVGVPEAQPAADRLRAEPPVDRDPDDVPEGRFRGRAGRAASGSAAIAAAICRTGAARSSAGCARRRCARSSRPTRSSSASTSARSTSR